MSVKELFDFVTDPSIASGDVQPYLEKMQEITASRVAEKPTAEEQVEEQVFQQAFIPKRLDEVNSLKTSLALYIWLEKVWRSHRQQMRMCVKSDISWDRTIF